MWRCCSVVDLKDVTQLDNVVYIIRTEYSKISRFDATTHRRLPDMVIEDFSESRDRPRYIAACQCTSRLYVADRNYVWRVSSGQSGGTCIQRWLPKSSSASFSSFISALSVTASRLLVTFTDHLRQFDVHGVELRRVDVSGITHAVELPTGLLIVSHYIREKKHYQVSKVNTAGQLFNSSPALHTIPHMAVDSKGNVLVAYPDNRQILLIGPELRQWHAIVDENQLSYEQPMRLCYIEQSGQLLVGLKNRGSVAVFNVCTDK